MKKLLGVQMLFVFCVQEASIVHKAYEFTPNPGVIKGILPLKNVHWHQIGKDYVNYLRTGKGNPLLYDLISRTTESQGFEPLGLDAQDIRNIKSFIVLPDVIEFAVPALPEWLAVEYNNVTDQVITQDLQADIFNFLGPQEIRAGVAEYFVQSYNKTKYGHTKYLYVKKGKGTTLKSGEKLEDAIKSILLEAHPFMKYIRNIAGLANITSVDDIREDFLDPLVKYIIVTVQDLSKLQNQLQILLEKWPNLKIIIALDDGMISIADNQKIPHYIRRCVITGKNLQGIENKFTNNNRALISLELPDHVTHLGYHFLADCKALKYIELPQELIKIGNDFLRGCTALTMLKIPHKLSVIDSSFLFGCTSLRAIELPELLSKVGNSFLVSCSSLKSLILPNNLQEIGSFGLYDCINLEELHVPQHLKKVEYQFLGRCKNLKYLKLPSGLKYVGGYFLSGCSSLKNLELPHELAWTGKNFLTDTSLTTLSATKAVFALPNIKKFISQNKNVQIVVLDE